MKRGNIKGSSGVRDVHLLVPKSAIPSAHPIECGGRHTLRNEIPFKSAHGYDEVISLIVPSCPIDNKIERLATRSSRFGKTGFEFGWVHSKPPRSGVGTDYVFTTLLQLLSDFMR